MNANQWKLLEELKEENAKLRAEVRAMEHRISSWMERSSSAKSSLSPILLGCLMLMTQLLHITFCNDWYRNDKRRSVPRAVAPGRNLAAVFLRNGVRDR